MQLENNSFGFRGSWAAREGSDHEEEAKYRQVRFVGLFSGVSFRGGCMPVAGHGGKRRRGC